MQIEHGRQHQIRILAALMRRTLGVMLAEIGGLGAFFGISLGVYWGHVGVMRRFRRVDRPGRVRDFFLVGVAEWAPALFSDLWWKHEKSFIY